MKMKTEKRVVRGGSWVGPPTPARVADCGRGTPDDRLLDLGVRLARDPIHKLAKECE